MADVAEQNRLIYNDQASSYNKRFEVAIAQITEDIQERHAWISPDLVPANSPAAAAAPPLRVLDYACGTGLITHASPPPSALSPYFAHFTGIDLSENMVAEYNSRAARAGIPAVAHLGNLVKPDTPSGGAFDGPQFADFDVAAVGLGFHHFADAALAAVRLAARLRSGGVLVIVDNLGEEGGEGNGFAPERVREMFEAAGVGGGFECVVLERPLRIGERVQRIFMARGTKA